MTGINRKIADTTMIALLAAIYLCGCADQSKESAAPPPPPTQTHNVAGQAPGKSAAATGRPLMLAHRGMLLNDGSQMNTSPKPNRGVPQPRAVPQRMSPRMAAVSKLKSWAPIKVETQGVDVWMKSSWNDGQLNVRVAMIGPQDGLTQFVNGVNGFELEFTDPSGAQTMTFNIQPTDFQWAPTTVNNGAPTMQFESSIDCPIEAYEQSTNWNFKWN